MEGKVKRPGTHRSTKTRKTEPKAVCGLTKAGIWERDEGIFELVRDALGEREVVLLRGSHGADFAAQPLDLLCVSPAATGWAGLNALECRTLLLPGPAGPLARGLRCKCAVSYGASPRDTLTFSSLEGGRACAALQRELVTLDGRVVEQQEFHFSYPPQRSPLPFLAAAGALLIIGLEPVEITAFISKIM